MKARTIGALLSIVIAASVAGTGGFQVGRKTAPGPPPAADPSARAAMTAQPESTRILNQAAIDYIMGGPVEEARSEVGLRDERVEPLAILDNHRTGGDSEQIVVVRLTGVDDDGPVTFVLGVHLRGADHVPTLFRAYDYQQ